MSMSEPKFTPGPWSMDKPILDACCGSRMFWFDKDNPNVLFVDNRELETSAIWKSSISNARRYCKVHPDILADFRHLPFDDETFVHVVFDPPHLTTIGDSSWMAKKYGKLPAEWRQYLHDGFTECWRVLKTYGTLVFKWSETQISVKNIITAIGKVPLYGHKCGRLSKTHWLVFVKLPKDRAVLTSQGEAR